MSERWETPEQLDSAIDALLGQPGWLLPVGEGALSATARLLRDSLPRFHPRFGFEERLAQRLGTAGWAGARRRGGQATVVAFRRPDGPSDAEAGPGEGTVPRPGPFGERRRRGLVAGGAIASGVSLAIPIAGAAVVAWRRLRAPEGLP